VGSAFVSLLIGCFALLPNAQAVSPPPDGGYPGGNTAEGQAARLNLTTGGFNTALGWLSLERLPTAVSTRLLVLEHLLSTPQMKIRPLVRARC